MSYSVFKEKKEFIVEIHPFKDGYPQNALRWRTLSGGNWEQVISFIRDNYSTNAHIFIYAKRMRAPRFVFGGSIYDYASFLKEVYRGR
jgi:hypothetical protein